MTETMAPSTALAVRSPNHSGAIAVYDTIADKLEFCKEMAQSFTDLTGCTVGQGRAVALVCLCEGLTPLDFRKRYHMIEGKPTMRADAMLAEFRMNFGGQYRIVSRTADLAAIELTLNGQTSEFSFSWEECLQSRWPWKKGVKPGSQPTADNLKDNYSTPTDRKAMMWARLVSDSLRAMCPELVAGVYTPEEVQDVIEGEYTHVTPLTAPAKPTATQMVAQLAAEQAAAAAGATGDVGRDQDAPPLSGPESGDGGADDVVDAEFTPAVAASSDPTVAAASGADTSTTADQSAAPNGDDKPTGTIRRDQIEAINKLLAELTPTPSAAVDKLNGILAKRGLTEIGQLSREQAKEIRQKLLDVQKAQATTAGN